MLPIGSLSGGAGGIFGGSTSSGARSSFGTTAAFGDFTVGGGASPWELLGAFIAGVGVGVTLCAVARAAGR